MKLLILSDIHGNYPALQAILDAEKNWNKLAFLGDVVDYGPNPRECVEFLEAFADYVVQGNHDHALGYGVDCKSRGDFHDMAVATRAWHKRLLGQKDIAYLKAMPITETFIFSAHKFLIAHASPRGDMFRYLSRSELADEVQNIDAEFVLLGHTHCQFQQKTGKLWVVNPGSVGLARDGTQACYAVFDSERIILRRVEYDRQRTITDLEHSRLESQIKKKLINVLTRSLVESQ
jgi:putative phosphoesterase